MLYFTLGEHWADGEYPSVDKRAGRAHIYAMNNNITADYNTKVMPIKTFVGSGFGSAFGTSFAVTESGNCFL